ncbi:MAG TPA: hypothetical protein VJV79_23160 [Polyangiaceae bacterium]|nr:hypothetical protein [Polyangiaceae bacterium]
MSDHETDPPERLRAAGATHLERRLLEAASDEQPTRDLSERMARGIGVSLTLAPASGASGRASTGTQAVKAADASRSLVPWLSGALVVTGVVAGALVATLPDAKPALPSAVMAPTLSAPAASSVLASAVPAPLVGTQPTDPAPASDGSEGPPAKAASSTFTRGHRGPAAGELANQIALVDAARSALAGGDGQRALAIVREYQSEYPTGTFRPEVSAVKIEALVKLGRTTEARTLAEKFVVAYGRSPLAARVARLAQITEP